ncbi:MAG: hypothetical protein HN354_02460 [Deltaproteobacteria bacterium]|jgi:hypothetical protein|nr:hypothetical protein [Deltaproteobacteria bacterium]
MITGYDKFLFQIPALEKGTNRFADDSPEKAITRLKPFGIGFLKHLITEIEDC